MKIEYTKYVPACVQLTPARVRKILKRKVFTRGRTDHFSSILADREYLASCYLLTVSNSGLHFKYVQPLQ